MLNVRIPNKLIPLFQRNYRFICAYGGRASGKSYSFALMALVRGYNEPLNILCCREFQNSIADSMHEEFKNVLSDYPILDRFYDVKEKKIKGKNGTQIFYKGLHRNLNTVKSMSSVDICIVEEAEPVTYESWETLIPTIRRPNSQIWVIFNPKNEDSETYKRFVLSDPKPYRKTVKINWYDNPWYPKVLDNDRLELLERNPGRYSHVWEGETESRSDSLILASNVTIKAFKPRQSWVPYFGCDFGHSVSPTTLNRVYFEDNKIYVEYESFKHNINIDDIPKVWLGDVPDCDRYPVWADCSRPETISYLRRRGIRGIRPCYKYAGSILEGVEFMRQKEIIIHPRCENTIQQALSYSYKIDRRTGLVLPDIIDADNDTIDGIRYALQAFIKPKKNVKPKKVELR